jgi:hypothetical protein
MTWLQLQESLRAPSQLQSCLLNLVVEKKKKLPRRNGELVITKITYMRTETNFHSTRGENKLAVLKY